MADKKDTAPAAKAAPAADLSSTDNASIEALDALKQKLADTEAELAATKKTVESGGFSADDQALIRAKVEAGLSVAQAQDVVRNQKKHDADLAAK